MYCALWRWEKQATSCHAAQASDFHLQLFAPVMWTQLVSQGQDPYTMFMLHPLIKPLQREVFDCRRKKWLFDWFAVKCTHKQEILTDDFDDLPVETERKGHVSTIIYNTDVFVLSTNCWVAQWQGGQNCCFTARRSWVLIHQLAGGLHAGVPPNYYYYFFNRGGNMGATKNIGLVPPVILCVLCRYSSFLPQSKGTLSGFRLPNAHRCECLSLSMLTLQQAGNLSRVYPAPHPMVADVGSSLPTSNNRINSLI